MGKVENPRIAFVHDFLTVFAGAERVLLALHELYPTAPIYTLLADPEVIQRHFPKTQIITSGLQRSFLHNHPQLLLPWMPQAIEKFNFTSFDLVLSSSGAFSHGIITGPDTTHICYCHSPMRYAWDWHAEYLAERGVHTPLSQLIANQIMSKIRLWDAIAAKRVDHWIANSHTVADRLQKFYRVESTVVYPPVDTNFFDPQKAHKSESSKPYAVTVSRLSKNKRIDQIIEGCAAEKIHLVIGGEGSDKERLKEIAHAKHASVEFRGALSEEEKRTLIANASCFIFAAEDDFGIAPVEALALGVPVIALGKGGATESVKNGVNGILYNEPTSSALAEALRYFREYGVSGTATEIRESSLKFNEASFNRGIEKVVHHG